MKYESCDIITKIVNFFVYLTQGAPPRLTFAGFYQIIKHFVNIRYHRLILFYDQKVILVKTKSCQSKTSKV